MTFCDLGGGRLAMQGALLGAPPPTRQVESAQWRKLAAQSIKNETWETCLLPAPASLFSKPWLETL